MERAFSSDATSTLLPREMHIRFMKEALAGDPLHMVGGVVSIGKTDMQVLQLLIHTRTNLVSAVIQSRISHVTAREGLAFEWSARTLTSAQALKIEVPEGLGPRSLALGGLSSSGSIGRANELDLLRIGMGAFLPQDCDVFGRMRPEVILGRISDGVASLIAPARDVISRSAPSHPQRVGGAVLENRLVFLDWPRSGDRFEVRSGLIGHDSKTMRIAHWFLDPASGQPWASSEAVAITFDLDARKIVPISQEATALLHQMEVAGLAV